MPNKYHPEIHTHTCELCGAEYTTTSGTDWGVCHNCHERARQFVQEQVFINEGHLDDFTVLDFNEMLFHHFDRLCDIDVDKWGKCEDEINELISNNTPKEVKDE